MINQEEAREGSWESPGLRGRAVSSSGTARAINAHDSSRSAHRGVRSDMIDWHTPDRKFKKFFADLYFFVLLLTVFNQ